MIAFHKRELEDNAIACDWLNLVNFKDIFFFFHNDRLVILIKKISFITKTAIKRQKIFTKIFANFVLQSYYSNSNLFKLSNKFLVKKNEIGKTKLSENCGISLLMYKSRSLLFSCSLITIRIRHLD